MMECVEDVRTMNVHFEIYFLCVQDIDILDGSQLCLQWVRGENTVESSIKLAMQGRAYFQQRFSMKTSIKYINDVSQAKLTQIKLLHVQVGNKKELFGESEIDLAKFDNAFDTKT